MLARSSLASIAVTMLALLTFGEATKAQGRWSPPLASMVSPRIEEPTSPRDGAAPTTKVKDENKGDLSFTEEFNREMKKCMDTWDAGTHMTRSQWRRVCHRNLE
jgi:hypothetical protein